MTERNIRKILASISARLKNPSLSNKDFLTLMRHQERLCEEMRLVEISRLETAIAQQEAGRPSGLRTNEPRARQKEAGTAHFASLGRLKDLQAQAANEAFQRGWMSPPTKFANRRNIAYPR
jgi:hypothetical protein